MNLTIYASDAEIYTPNEIMEAIKDAKKWSVLGYHDDSKTCFDIETDAGRSGTYDVTSDTLLWNDDEYETEYNLFGAVHDMEVITYSLAEFIAVDGSTGVWGEGDDGYSYYWIAK